MFTYRKLIKCLNGSPPSLVNKVSPSDGGLTQFRIYWEIELKSLLYPRLTLSVAASSFPSTLFWLKSCHMSSRLPEQQKRINVMYDNIKQIELAKPAQISS